MRPTIRKKDYDSVSNTVTSMSQDSVSGETHIDQTRRQNVEVIDSMLSDFDGQLKDDVVGMFSSMTCPCPREINSISHSDEESALDFDNMVSHFRGDISDENMKRLCKIELDQLKIDLISNIPMEELNKWTIKDFCRHVFKEKTHALMCVCYA